MSTTQYYLMVGTGLLGAVLLIALVVGYYYFQEFRNNFAVLHNVNDGNVAYSNGLNATIRDLRDAAVEQSNVISMYDDAAADRRREVDGLNKELVDYMNRDISNKTALLSLECKYDRLVEVNQKDFDTIANMRERLADAHGETGKQRRQVEHHEITIKEYIKLLNDSRDAVCDAQTEIRNATEALEFLKSELVMAERQSVQQKLENEATVSYYKSQVAGSTRV